MILLSLEPTEPRIHGTHVHPCHPSMPHESLRCPSEPPPPAETWLPALTEQQWHRAHPKTCRDLVQSFRSQAFKPSN